MSIYGEGLYKDSRGRICDCCDRSLQQIKAQEWEMRNEEGETLTPIPTPETKTPSLASIYALSKYDQEQMCLMIGRAYDIPAVALRFFNIFGPNQALSNPYTGVLAIFASRLLNNRPPLINEDGMQKRDFVSVYDVARACRLALETKEADGQTFNIASGNQYTMANSASGLHGPREKHRAGDHRQVPGRRYPPLLRRYYTRAEGTRLRAMRQSGRGLSRSGRLAGRTDRLRPCCRISQ